MRYLGLIFTLPAVPFWLIGYRLVGIKATYTWPNFDVTPGAEVTESQYLISRLFPFAVLVPIVATLARL
jgi:hypothetical protein